MPLLRIALLFPESLPKLLYTKERTGQHTGLQQVDHQYDEDDRDEISDAHRLSPT